MAARSGVSVKIRFETGGAQTVRPDFGMLREGLRVAQETTPTAIANAKTRAAQRHSEALVRMFAGSKAPEPGAGEGSFYPGLPPQEDEQAKK
jgi:hypothetical protein